MLDDGPRGSKNEIALHSCRRHQSHRKPPNRVVRERQAEDRKLIAARLSPMAFTRILISPAPGSGVGTSTILKTSAGPTS